MCINSNPRRGTYAAALCFIALLLVPATVSAQAAVSPALREKAAGAGRLSVIVTTRPGHDASGEAAHLRGRIRRQVTAEIAAVEVDADEVEQLAAAPGIERLSLDLDVRSTADPIASAVGADQVWAADRYTQGFTGRGVGVAVIDSGVSLHPDLQPRVAARLDFTGEGVDDGYGHGTHVAGMVAGNGRSSGGQNAGIAPGASIVSLKVLDHTGVGKTSDVIAAIEWVIQHGRHYGIRVINLSIGHPVVESYRSDPLNLAVQKAVSRGFVVVTSAGNTGRTDEGSVQYGGVLSPANDPSVITVGAVDTNGTAFRSDDVVADFSARGPTVFDGFVKPDVVAPGRRITSTAAPFSYLATTFPERLVGGATPEGVYQTLSGTSMAASSSAARWP